MTHSGETPCLRERDGVLEHGVLARNSGVGRGIGDCEVRPQPDDLDDPLGLALSAVSTRPGQSVTVAPERPSPEST